ncbi:MAG TPA: class I SAM-dependent methyltransferase [Acidimicrobiia bacterium]|jgi:SAM-dependent methyltransferase|nr:class I SAM-dependent methyltransferase [Acidimicrobiia bacterium]
MIRGWWTEPVARGVDLGSAEAAEIQRRILATKPSLRRAYEQIYAKMVAVADLYVPGAQVRVEVGSGGGFLPEIVPSIVASDIRPIPGLDLVFDARHAPFRDASVDVVFAMHVVHHIPSVRMFFAELVRVLRPGGALVAVEPYWSPFAKFLYKRVHPESFDEHADRWEFESAGPMTSNQAMSYLLLQRDRSMFEREFPALEVIELGAFGGPSYVLTGGIWKQKLLPDRALARLSAFEDAHTAWRRFLALHHLFVLRRR